MECPNAEEVAALLAHALDSERRAAIVDHAASCAACHAVIAELATDLATVLSEPPSSPASPDEAAHVRRALLDALASGRRTRIGRYQLLELVGAGGMGVVWGAWDPELARRVALKLVHPRVQAARDRILAEGQALGKLSHPNVVPVYDVGIVDEQVYLVMEWVQGTTLRAYASSPCSLRELIDAYRQAGDGLAAAHRAGLVHRDFKPDNAIRGDDGRVRVLDFGLARSDDEAPEPVKRLAGTLRYMPPEQAAGGKVTPAADQYAFATSLREALLTRPGDGRPIPRRWRIHLVPYRRDRRSSSGEASELPSWVAAVVARGTAVDPAERYASMEELLRALARDPARIWRRRGIAVAGLVGVAAAFVVGRAHGGAPESCVGSTAEIARSWSAGSRAQMAGHLRSLGAFGAGEADRLGDELDHYAASWAGEHRRACLAHEQGELPAVQHERRIACLARGKAALGAVAELMTSVDAAGLLPALVAARSLPSPAGCAAADAASVPPPPDAVAAQVATVAPTVERARVRAIAVRPDAIAIASEGVAAAERTGYTPLIARAQLALGCARDALDAGEVPARESFERALDLALRGSDDPLAVEAYARLIWAVGRYRGDVVGNWPVMEAIAVRTGPLGQFGRVLLYNNKAVARLAQSDRDGARRLLQQAAAALPRDPVGNGEIELVSVLQNLALVAEQPAERAARAREVVHYLEAALGPNHPNTLAAHVVAGTVTGHPATAAADLQVACDGYQRWHPDRLRALVDCSFARGWLADERGDIVGARAAMELAAADPLSPKERARGTIARNYLAITGDSEASVRAAVATLQDLAAQAARATEWWLRGEAAEAYVTAALGWQRLGKLDDAEHAWAAALGVLEGLHEPVFDRALARTRAALARRWADGRRDDARRAAREALAWYRAAGGYDAAVAELEPIATP